MAQPFKVRTVITEYATRIDYQVYVRATFASQLVCTDLVLRIPVPPSTHALEARVSSGRWKHVPGEFCFKWK